MTRLTLTVFVLALATTAAQAGPIRWTYYSPYTERDIPGVANVKIWGESSFAPPSWNEESEYYRPYGIRVLTNHTAEISRPHLHREGYIDQYDSPVTLTDLVSGQSGQFLVPMTIRLTWNSDDVFVEKLPFTTRLTLGGNIYSVENDYDSYVKVTVTQPVPEPATVMVMGLGLLGLGLARRFRRSPR